MTPPFPSLAEWIQSAKSAVVLTGAGISTESGIPDFRSPGGVWSTTQPVYFDEFLQSAAARHEYWRQKAVSHREFSQARPNPGHGVLARWEAAGLIRGVITQNIDGLHQDAGNQQVLELHGTAREIACLSCPLRWPADPLVEQFLETDRVPDCPECGGLLKHATISFGQALDDFVLYEAAEWSQTADLFLVLGTSLVVQPAAGLPEIAWRAGARVVIINRDPTPLDHLADLTVSAPLGETLTAIDAALQ